eukprot:Hpha_TRINITY_DN26108_c0_g1::TRINITY_DN26108_c0_g1_i1::g.155270::m.155270
MLSLVAVWCAVGCPPAPAGNESDRRSDQTRIRVGSFAYGSRVETSLFDAGDIWVITEAPNCSALPSAPGLAPLFDPGTGLGILTRIDNTSNLAELGGNCTAVSVDIPPGIRSIGLKNCSRSGAALVLVDGGGVAWASPELAGVVVSLDLGTRVSLIQEVSGRSVQSVSTSAAGGGGVSVVMVLSGDHQTFAVSAFERDIATLLQVREEDVRVHETKPASVWVRFQVGGLDEGDEFWWKMLAIFAPLVAIGVTTLMVVYCNSHFEDCCVLVDHDIWVSPARTRSPSPSPWRNRGRWRSASQSPSPSPSRERRTFTRIPPHLHLQDAGGTQDGRRWSAASASRKGGDMSEGEEATTESVGVCPAAPTADLPVQPLVAHHLPGPSPDASPPKED